MSRTATNEVAVVAVPRRVLIANRGEIAVRIARACFDEGVSSVAAYSSADSASLVRLIADDAIQIGPADASRSYLDIGAVIAAALAMGCDSVHPGYGFLSERADFAAACRAHGLIFIGPEPETIRRGGDKLAALELARSIGIPVAGGSGAVLTAEEAVAAAVGQYPVLIKASAGGGGRGMVRADDEQQLRDCFATASREAEAAFGDGRVYIERYISNAQHVEIQLLADRRGNIVHLGDRDCSCQRRHQKLIEEAPASTVSTSVRRQLAEAALTLARELGYVGAGTVEFLIDKDRDRFYFLEINTRLQVEHGVTEAVTGIDIVREQLRVAAGSDLSFRQSDVRFSGHAIEVRINAEDPTQDFGPRPGVLEQWVPPIGSAVRVDTHCYPGYTIPPNYDSLLAKLIAHDQTRLAATTLMSRALDRFHIGGVTTTRALHRGIVEHTDFRRAEVNTRWLQDTFLPEWLAYYARSDRTPTPQERSENHAR